MVMKFANNATTKLAAGINTSVTSLDVTAGTGALFPTLGGGDYFYCTLANTTGGIEIIKVTARSTDTFTIVRGQDGTTAASWLLNDTVELRLVAASLNDLPKLDEANAFTNATESSSTSTGAITTAGGLGVVKSAYVGGNSVVGGTQTVAGRVTNSVGTVSGPWTTAARPATPTDGLSGFNTDLNKLETWDATNSAWVTSGGATGAGGNDVFYENGQTVTSSYTITTNKNASSTGPITINSGVSVTIPSGSRWVIL